MQSTEVMPHRLYDRTTLAGGSFAAMTDPFRLYPTGYSTLRTLRMVRRPAPGLIAGNGDPPAQIGGDQPSRGILPVVQ